MPITNYPNGLSSFGVPVVGGINGIPLTGSWFFVDYANGSDGNGVNSSRTALGSNNGGAPPNAPMKTIAAALDRCLAGNNDVIVIMSDGSTAASQRLSSTLVWSKDATHLVGMTAPCIEAQRARITTANGATTNLSPLMSITASGCMFANFSFFQGVGEAATAEQLLNITGSRNYFGNIQFGGMGSVNGATNAGSYCINITDGGENYFQGCVIGLETRQRNTTNANLVVAYGAALQGAQRNTFDDCIFVMSTSSSGALFVNASDSNCLNGSSMRFRRCSFQSLLNISSAATPAAVASVAADANGTIWFEDCTSVAATWASTTELVQVQETTSTAATNGIFDGV